MLFFHVFFRSSLYRERINGNRAAHGQLISTSSSIDAEFEVQHHDVLDSVKGIQNSWHMLFLFFYFFLE